MTAVPTDRALDWFRYFLSNATPFGIGSLLAVVVRPSGGGVVSHVVSLHVHIFRVFFEKHAEGAQPSAGNSATALFFATLSYYCHKNELDSRILAMTGLCENDSMHAPEVLKMPLLHTAHVPLLLPLAEMQRSGLREQQPTIIETGVIAAGTRYHVPASRKLRGWGEDRYVGGIASRG